MIRVKVEPLRRRERRESMLDLRALCASAVRKEITTLEGGLAAGRKLVGAELTCHTRAYLVARSGEFVVSIE